MLHSKAAGRTPCIVAGSPSLGTTPRNIDLVHGSVSSSRAICRVSISVVADDVAAPVDFQHGLEFGVAYDVHGGLQCVAEMKFYAQVASLYQMEAGAVALVGRQVKTEEGVTVSVVAASQTVALVLPNLTGRGEQAHIAPDEEVVLEIGLKGFGGYLSSVHVHRVEAYGVVLGVKRILVVRTVVGIVIDAAQHQTFRQSAEEQVIVRVRPSTRGNGVHLAVDGPLRILDRALLHALNCLQRLWPVVDERGLQRCLQRRRGLVLHGNTPGHFREDVDHREEKGHTVVVVFQLRQVYEIGLPLLMYTTHDDASSLEMTSRWFV